GRHTSTWTRSSSSRATRPTQAASPAAPPDEANGLLPLRARASIVKSTGGATGRCPEAERGWIVYARSTTIQAQPSAIDDGIAHMRDVVLPELQEIPGCVGLSLMVDRTNGRCIATSSWETEEAMHASAERVGPIRERAIALFGGSAH